MTLWFRCSTKTEEQMRVLSEALDKERAAAPGGGRKRARLSPFLALYELFTLLVYDAFNNGCTRWAWLQSVCANDFRKILDNVEEIVPKEVWDFLTTSDEEKEWMKPLEAVPEWVLEEGGFDWERMPGGFDEKNLRPVQAALVNFCYTNYKVSVAY